MSSTDKLREFHVRDITYKQEDSWLITLLSVPYFDHHALIFRRPQRRVESLTRSKIISYSVLFVHQIVVGIACKRSFRG